MSKLFHNENGRVIPLLCEELTIFRRAKILLDLPPTEFDATLFILAQPHQLNKNPLCLSINGILQEVIQPVRERNYLWYEHHLKADNLIVGNNVVELWTEKNTMTGWSLAMELDGVNSNSFLTDDGGVNWRSERMSYLNTSRGNYCVRIRLQEGFDPLPPQMIWELPNHPRIQSLRESIPSAVHKCSDRLAQVRSLASWLSSSWQHSGSNQPLVYTPWDAETILEWGRTQKGHNNETPVAMCVHFAVALVTFCQALRIPARCAALIGTPNSYDGHFVTEIWIDTLRKWVMMDPNCDAIFVYNGEPLSIQEIRNLNGNLTQYVQWGSGTRYQQTFPHMQTFIMENLLKGVCFKHFSIWPRTDFLSHPEYSPPGHGTISYCETDLVWCDNDYDAGFGMFKYFAPETYFTAPPDYVAYV
tara:strand:- start:1642 stop:2889 length:1248 start_codon:yes stop_codon:yes gene_type:complete